MIHPALYSLIVFILTTFGLIGLYNEFLIMRPKYYLYIGILFMLIYYFVRRRHSSRKKADKLMILSSSLMFVSMLSSFVNEQWKLTNMISSITMMKILLVLLTIGTVYINFVYVRAEQSYKKKRGNQRIREEPKKSFLEELKESFKKEDENEVVLTLGISAENEDV